MSDLMLVDENVSGKSCLQKVEDLRKEMEKKDTKWLVVTALDDIACKLIVQHLYSLHNRIRKSNIVSSSLLKCDITKTRVNRKTVQ